MDEIVKKIGTKNLIIIGIGFASVIACIIIGALIYHSFFYKKSFSEIEGIMTNAAYNYYAKHKEELPKNSGDKVTLGVSTLVQGEYMKTFNEYLKDDTISCKGSVNVTNSNGEYRYVPLLDCGKNYSYQLLTSRIRNKQKIVNSGNGLYNLNGSLVYRGERINNYVKFAGFNWRIVKIIDNKIMLIYDDEKPTNMVWDDRYNPDREGNDGINDYSVSRIKDSIDDLYNGNDMFDDDEKLLLSKFDLYAGKVGENDNDKDGNLAKGTVIENQYMGLLNISDFMNASLDTRCTNAANPSCSNYNYLASFDNYNWWSLTTDKDTTYNVYQIDDTSGAYTQTASYDGYLRPVIMITSDAIYTGGNGSSSKPYTFK